jgi:hypothetical protein
MVAGSRLPGAYLVRLIDCTDAIGEADRTTILNQLTISILAADSTRPPSDQSGANLAWAKSVGDSPTAVRLLIYFVANYHRSVVRFVNYFRRPQGWERATGLTFMPWSEERDGRRVERPSASEVYCNKCDGASDLAMFAFHEAMHNQLHMDDEMHSDPTVGGGIASAALISGTTPNAYNLAAFGAAMNNVHPQWIDGYARAHPRHATHPLHPHH